MQRDQNVKTTTLKEFRSGSPLLSIGVESYPTIPFPDSVLIITHTIHAS
jgi:hypothetical protein